MKITDVQRGKKNSRRLNIFVDGVFAFACFEEIFVEAGLAKGSEVDEAFIAEVRSRDDKRAAREFAFASAAQGPKTEKQFRERLLHRGYQPESVDAAIGLLREYAYIDDEAYAHQYASELLARKGRWAVRRKLHERGISSEIIESVLMNADDSEALAFQLARLRDRPHHADPRRERERIVRSLAAKGFDYKDIKRAIQETWDQA